MLLSLPFHKTNNWCCLMGREVMLWQPEAVGSPGPVISSDFLLFSGEKKEATVAHFITTGRSRHAGSCFFDNFPYWTIFFREESWPNFLLIGNYKIKNITVSTYKCCRGMASTFIKVMCFSNIIFARQNNMYNRSPLIICCNYRCKKTFVVSCFL